jgi:hypothetical protein
MAQEVLARVVPLNVPSQDITITTQLKRLHDTLNDLKKELGKGLGLPEYMDLRNEVLDNINKLQAKQARHIETVEVDWSLASVIERRLYLQSIVDGMILYPDGLHIAFKSNVSHDIFSPASSFSELFIPLLRISNRVGSPTNCFIPPDYATRSMIYVEIARGKHLIWSVGFYPEVEGSPFDKSHPHDESIKQDHVDMGFEK